MNKVHLCIIVPNLHPNSVLFSCIFYLFTSYTVVTQKSINSFIYTITDDHSLVLFEVSVNTLWASRQRHLVDRDK